VDFRNSLFGKTAYLTRDIAILSTISPVFAAAYVGSLFGAGFREYHVEVHSDERAPNLSVNDPNQWVSYPKKSIINSWRNPKDGWTFNWRRFNDWFILRIFSEYKIL
jgi:hypothetical protein